MSCADQLMGLTLNGGWKVIQKLAKPGTGGSFSVGYKAQHPDGRLAFVKAMDYTEVFRYARRARIPNSVIIQLVSEEYNFEKEFSKRCKDLSLKRVAYAIENGEYDVDPNDIHGNVEYLIFELAEGDVRTYLQAQADIDLIFAMRSLHNIACGLFHLHTANMAHQDLKPSNSLIFGAEGTKICDFGKSWCLDIHSPCDDYEFAGDSGYTPFELTTKAIPVSTEARRFGCDMYQFGSMIVFFFTFATMRGLMESHLDRIRPAGWTGSFAALLPYLQAAFAESLDEFDSQIPPAFKDYREDLVTMVRQLCEPDPTKRGHPDDRMGRQYSFERYVSKLNLLAYRAETGFISRNS